MTGYLKATDIMQPNLNPDAGLPERSVSPGTPLPDLLGKLLDSPDGVVGVADGPRLIGTVDASGMLRGMGMMIAPRDDASLICVDCPPADYSASALARAVEDADAHLVDLWTVPTDHNSIKVTLRVRHSDPSVCVRNLERHGFEVVDAVGAGYADADAARERLLELRTLLNV